MPRAVTAIAHTTSAFGIANKNIILALTPGQVSSCYYLVVVARGGCCCCCCCCGCCGGGCCVLLLMIMLLLMLFSCTLWTCARYILADPCKSLLCPRKKRSAGDDVVVADVVDVFIVVAFSGTDTICAIRSPHTRAIHHIGSGYRICRITNQHTCDALRINDFGDGLWRVRIPLF